MSQSMLFDPDSGPFSFFWHVDRHGYQIEQRPVGDAGSPVRVVSRKGGGLRVYQFGPEHDGLFRRFADLETRPEDIKVFANEFGLLWQPEGDFDDYLSWVVAINELKSLVAAIDEGAHETVWHFVNEGRTQPRFTIYVEPDETSARLARFRLKPISLIAALWLQAAEQSIIGTRFKQCEQCPNWFPVGPGTRRKPSKRFCSDRCRVAWHRGQKRKSKNAG